MKQFESHGVTFFHNGDFSGDVHMQKERGAGFAVPGAALRALCAELLSRPEKMCAGCVEEDETGRRAPAGSHDPSCAHSE